jgi:diguanylate cyclase (GGDEF)-like protein
MTADDPLRNARQRHLTRRFNAPLAWGFAVLLTLMLALVAHAVWNISALEDRMREIVETLNRKIQLATDLQEAAYNRHSALVYQTLTQDPFERDDSFQLFIKWGYHVGKARNDLKAMPLDDFERNNLARQDRLIVRISALHDELVDLAARGLITQAHARMATELRPLNLEFTDTVEQLRRHERDRIQAALVATQNATRQAVRLHLALGGGLLLLAVLIGLATHRLLARQAHTICRQMIDLEEASHRLEHEATHDPLTGLANRSLFQRRMAEAIAHAQEEGYLMGVMYLDLDDFKQVNDTHGHDVGDALLREVAQRLRQVVRTSDTVARLGGDEFALVLTGLTNPDQCQELKQKIESEVMRPAALGDIHLTPHGSAGCVLYPRDGQTLEDLLKAADQRMYASKRARKTQGFASA